MSWYSEPKWVCFYLRAFPGLVTGMLCPGEARTRALETQGRGEEWSSGREWERVGSVSEPHKGTALAGDPRRVWTCITHYLFKVMIFGERAVIFRTRLSNLINDSDCRFPPESTFPGPCTSPWGLCWPGTHGSPRPSNWWLLPSGQIRPLTSDGGDQQLIQSNPPLACRPNLPHVRGLIASLRTWKWTGELPLAECPITKYQGREATGPPVPAHWSDLQTFPNVKQMLRVRTHTYR